ncbi:hypothetical protein EXIGLDRAFT_728221 [Exidia glandulosa HHB12029]|uniref:Uncharacterized protein n=1 Tax=Exidia glandulosa HHB12029 TaxID=1314781 RepID=A0A165ZKL0_EXIGL|nr:hypothetical protein EXIGLDRAFT_728221 [Exidia glandulosa HHB12029]
MADYLVCNSTASIKLTRTFIDSQACRLRSGTYGDDRGCEHSLVGIEGLDIVSPLIAHSPAPTRKPTTP